MKLAIMQPYLFPYLGYFQLIAAVDTFVVYDDVQFIKGGWINRNNFLVNGREYLFTFGVKKDSTYQKINERYFAENHEHQVTKFQKLLQANYKAAPHFESVYELITDILSFADTNVARKTHYSLVRLCQYLEISTRIECSSYLKISRTLGRQKRLIAIIKELGGKHYINPIGGKDLYNKQDFLNENISLSFLVSLPIVYDQLGAEFIPNLSIVDVMMFNSVEQINELLAAFTLL